MSNQARACVQLVTRFHGGPRLSSGAAAPSLHYSAREHLAAMALPPVSLKIAGPSERRRQARRGPGDTPSWFPGH
jgi:hypothetical protein